MGSSKINAADCDTSLMRIGVATATNANDLTDGEWKCASTMENLPEKTGFVIRHVDYNENYAVQFAMSMQSYMPYFRIKYYGYWEEWEQPFGRGNMPTIADIEGITISQTDLEPGVSELPEGHLWVVYE